MPAEISDASSVVDAVHHPDAEVLVYFGRGPSAFPLGLALQAASWNIPVVGNSSLTHGRMHPDKTAPWDGWIYLDMFADTPAVTEVNARLGPEWYYYVLQSCGPNGLVRHGPVIVPQSRRE